MDDLKDATSKDEPDTRQKTSRIPSKKIAVGTAIITILLIVGTAIYFGVNAYQEAQEAKAISEFNQVVDTAKQEFMAELDDYGFKDGVSIMPSGDEAEAPAVEAAPDPARNLEYIAVLTNWEEELDKASLTYHDGSTAAYDELVNTVRSKVEDVLSWFAERYEAAAAGYEAFDASAASKDDLNAKIAELDAFKATAVEEYAAEPKLWADQKAFDAWDARMDAARSTMSDAVAKIEEEEAAAEAQAQAQAQTTTYGSATNDGSGYNYYDGGSYSNSGDGSSNSGNEGSYGYIIDMSKSGEYFEEVTGHSPTPDYIDEDGHPHWD